ncbi:hypothetical protein D3C71_1360460 [compost metagenome]
MTEQDSLSSILGWNIPAVHHATAILSWEGYILVGEAFGHHRIGVQWRDGWIG